MANCHLCGQKLSFGPKISRVAGGQKMEFCLKCAIRWDEEQKQMALTLMYEGGDPIPYFTIQNVTTPDPSQKDYLFVGHLVFMDKGICFVKLSEYKKNAPTSPFAFGVITIGYLGAWLDQKIADRTPEHQANIQAAHKQAEQTKTENFKAFLQKGLSFLLYPRQSLITVGYDLKNGLLIKTNCRPNETCFALAPEAYRQVEPFIADYLGRTQ